MRKTTCQFPVFTIKTYFRNVSASGEVRFENSLNSLHGAFTSKTPAQDPSLPWNGVYFIKNGEKEEWPLHLQWRLKAISLVAAFKNLVAMW